LNNKGYVITSWHMVKNADSIFIENAKTDRSQIELVFSDPSTDIAILKIENPEAFKNWQVPFNFSAKTSEMGERVFTLGYPRKEMVYGEGSLSSLSGYHNDTTMYQISIPLNPGNSGGPLLDDQGTVIGLIRGKISGSEGTSFAIKSEEILNSLKNIEQDSVRNLLSVNSKKKLLKGTKRSDLIKRINPYVFNIMVYKSN
jgi:S1-C subfamily serine protease